MRYFMRLRSMQLTVLFCAMVLAGGSPALAQKANGDKGGKSDGSLVSLLADELDYSMRYLAMPDGTKPYFLSYSITDVQNAGVTARLGAVLNDNATHNRILDVEARVGDFKLDDTHRIRGERGSFDPTELL